MNNLFLLDNSLLRRRLRRRHRTEWVNEIYLKGEELREFHHIWGDLKIDNKRFYSYIRMNNETFEYILHNVKSHPTKFRNFRRTISPEERLVLTLR
jgi:hypothetical protein